MVVRDLQGPPFPELQGDALAQEAYTLFSSGQSAVAVMNDGTLEGIVTKSDLLEFWAQSRNQ
jgi:cystathionine beta-synthase